MCQRKTMAYDTSIFDPSQQNTWGRATSVQWGAVGCQSARGDVWTHWYSYTPAGLISAKGINLSRNSSPNGYPVSLYGFSLVGTYTYDNEGRQASVTYPTWYTMDAYDNPVSHAGTTYTYAFDSMGRPSALTDNDSPAITWIQNAVYNAADQITALP